MARFEIGSELVFSYEVRLFPLNFPRSWQRPMRMNDDTLSSTKKEVNENASALLK
jgi:hypothetical protein